MQVILLFLLALQLSSLYCVDQLCFVHIGKTGGTTMHALLRQHFKEGDFYPYRGMKELYPYKGLKDGEIVLQSMNESSEISPISHRVISGHFPLWWLHKKGVGPKAFCFTILRDPIQRVISDYFFKLKFESEIYRFPDHTPLDVLPNVMCRMLSSDPTLTGEDLLNDAISNLKKLDFIIFLDDFERGIRHFFKKIGIKHHQTIPRLNITERGQEIDQEMIEQIRNYNELDLRLYEYARTFLRYKSY